MLAKNKRIDALVDTLIKGYLIICGFLFCQNIIVPFKINSTSFNISLLFQIPLIIYLAIRRGKDVLLLYKRVPFTFYLFLLSIIVSLVPGLIVSTKIGGILPSIKGMIFYVLNSLFPIILGLLIPNEKKPYLFIGFLFGFFANFIISFIVHVVFYTLGYSLTLSKLFVNNSFFVPDYFASAQGLFLEPSHLAGFVLVMYYLLFWYYKSSKLRIALTILAWFLFIMYGMGNLTIFILTQLILAIYLIKKNFVIIKEKLLKNKKFILVIAIISTMLLAVFLILIFGPLKSKFTNAFEEMNPFGGKNKERLESIVVGLNIFLKHPFGVGFNMSGKYIMTFYSNVLKTPTVFSYFLKILMELGIFGIVSFLSFCTVLIKEINKKITGGFLLALAFVAGILFAFLDGPNEPYLYILIGIILSECVFQTDFMKYVKRIKTKLHPVTYIKIDI